MAIPKRTTKTGTTRWVARYRDATGKEHSRSFNTQRAAEAYLQDHQRAVRRNEWIAPTNTTVRERRDAADNASTAASRRGLLTNLGKLADLNVAAVKPAHIRAWLDALITGRPWADDKPLATSTATTYAAILHGVFTTAVNDDLIGRHPMRGAKLRKVEVAVERADIPTMADFRALIRAAESTGVGRAANPTLAAMVQVAAETGLRAGELCGLRVRNVNFLKGNTVSHLITFTVATAPTRYATVPTRLPRCP
ncbi:hypothetical protein [Corynebacterium endometrii]|uniref:Phage integrase family protein n=1 Tax=Corynebacterium endometrii TaxID=2488819 RepID=A0A4P7QGY2_9CORY|nr:hypothetical protein [Corynebacterium endometrii]QCB28859.1 hypothetical protein CENDO_07925 [Corynebacterium endometrii]